MSIEFSIENHSVGGNPAVDFGISFVFRTVLAMAERVRQLCQAGADFNSPDMCCMCEGVQRIGFAVLDARLTWLSAWILFYGFSIGFYCGRSFICSSSFCVDASWWGEHVCALELSSRKLLTERICCLQEYGEGVTCYCRSLLVDLNRTSNLWSTIGEILLRRTGHRSSGRILNFILCQLRNFPLSLFWPTPNGSSSAECHPTKGLELKWCFFSCMNHLH